MGYPGRSHFRFYQGDTARSTITWRVKGEPVDLDGYTAKMQVRSGSPAASPVLELTSGSGITLGSAGEISITVPAATTAALDPEIYIYSLELTSSGGEVTTLIAGQLTVTQEVTR